MGGPLISILFGYAVNCHSCALQRRTWYNTFPERDSNPLEPTRPPSPWFQCSFPLYIDFLTQLLRLLLESGFSVFLEYVINSFPVFYILYLSSANQSLADQRDQVVSQSEFSDVTFGSPRMFSIIHGNYLNTLSLLKHGARTRHWLLAHRIDAVLK